ncbi:MAG: aminotransferase class IV [Nitrospirae bacterium]|nr:aminotransferase class IV [Nitrospirota bacterium]
MPNLALIQGRIVPLKDARVPVEDRGFQFGDAVYEVIRTYGGRPFALPMHVARLRRSAGAIDLPVPWDDGRLTRWIRQLVRRSEFRESKIYIQVTRGEAPRNHPVPAIVRPALVMTVRRLGPPDRALRARGIRAVTMPDPRWARCDIKTVNLLANVLAREEARRRKVDDAIFIRGGFVAEATAANVFAVAKGRLVTPLEGPSILSGVTRACLIELAREAGIPVVERRISSDDLRRADEIFLTGTTVEVLPVVRLDGKPVGGGKPGPTAARLLREWRGAVSAGRWM